MACLRDLRLSSWELSWGPKRKVAVASSERLKVFGNEVWWWCAVFEPDIL